MVEWVRVDQGNPGYCLLSSSGRSLANASATRSPPHLPPDALSARSRLIMTYALCGFANFGGVGIMIGGMGAMVPDRRAEIGALGLRSVLSGTLATCMSAAVIGML